MGKLERKRAVERHRRRSENIIKVDLNEIECAGIDWIYLGQDRNKWLSLVSTVMNFGVP
jgi:hypothetical protein